MSAQRTPDTRRYRFAQGHRLQWEEAQNCYVILYPEGMVQLNESAAAILRQLDPERTVDDIVEALKAEFPDADDEIITDIQEFLEEAENRGWIRQV